MTQSNEPVRTGYSLWRVTMGRVSKCRKYAITDFRPTKKLGKYRMTNRGGTYAWTWATATGEVGFSVLGNDGGAMAALTELWRELWRTQPDALLKARYKRPERGPDPG